MADGSFIERRRESRLPFSERIIVTDGERTITSYAANISRGGIFALTLDPWPIDTFGYISFTLPNHPSALCVRAKIVHIVFDRQRCEIECGMGVQFQELTESQKTALNLHILEDQTTYRELKDLLHQPIPDLTEINALVKKMPHLARYDLLGLKYRVNRICTIFEPAVENPIEAGKLTA